jgi:hypothetical protein
MIAEAELVFNCSLLTFRHKRLDNFRRSEGISEEINSISVER